jgi:hypothetical protein
MFLYYGELLEGRRGGGEEEEEKERQQAGACFADA